MDQQKQFIPKSTGVEQLDSDDDPYDNIYDNTSMMGGGTKQSSATNITDLPNKSTLNINNNSDDDYEFNKYTIVSSHSSTGGVQNIIKIHTLNLNDRKQRLLLLSILLFIWLIPTLILSLDIYANNNHEQLLIHGYSIIDNKLHLSSIIIILTACLFLILFEFVEYTHFIINICIGVLYIVGGWLHFAAVIVYAHDHCHNSVTNIDNYSGYCYIGYIGATNLGSLLPFILGIDVIINILNNKYVRTIIFAFMLWFTTLFTVIALSKYGNGFSVDFGDVIIGNQLFDVISIGWWMLCICSFIGMIEIFVAIYILGWTKFKFDRIYMKTMNMFIGFVLIVSVSFVLVEKDGCITGKHLTDAVFCYYRLTYVLVGLTCVLSYELQTLSTI